MIGPLHLLVIGFDEDKRARDITRIVQDLKRAKAIRLIDLLYIIRHDNGEMQAKEISELRTDEKQEYGALIKKLIGMETQDVEQRDASELVDSLAVAVSEFGLSESEVQRIADRLPNGSSGILAIFEHTWARCIKKNIQEAGGTVRAQGLLDPATLEIAADELSVILDAINRAESSAMDQLVEVKVETEGESGEKEAALVVAETQARVEEQSQEIKARAVLQALNALVTAQVIEQTAARHAIDTIIAANVIEAAAVRKAARALTSG